MDPIGDMLTRIRNAIKAKKESLDLPASRVKEGIARILAEEGFIEKFEMLPRGNKKFLRILLKYTPAGDSVISELVRISKPGRHIFVDKDSIPLIKGGFGTVIISSSRGIISDKVARKLKVGGEIFCQIW